jgi:hypothetical protein
LRDAILKIPNTKNGWPSKCEALNSNPNTAKNKLKIPIRKCTKDEETIHQGDLQVANKLRKRCLTPKATREVQIKVTVSDYHTCSLSLSGGESSARERRHRGKD